MEDAHIAQLDMPGGVSVFGVFDGHGGKANHPITYHWPQLCRPVVPEANRVCKRVLIVCFRLGSCTLCEGAFLQGVREAKVILEQMLQRGIRGVFL